MTKPENPLKRADGTMIDGKECEAFPLSSQKFQQLSQDGAPTLPLMNVRQRGKKKTLFDEEKVTRQTVFDSEKVSSVEPEESKSQPDEATILSIGDVQIEKEDNGADTDNKSAEDSPGASGNETTEKLPDGSSVEPSESSPKASGVEPTDSSPKASGTAMTEAEKAIIDGIKEVIAGLERELEQKKDKDKQELAWKLKQKAKKEEKKKQNVEEMQKKEERRLNKNKKKKK